MGSLILKKLPLIGGLLLIVGLCMVLLITQLELSEGISSTLSTPAPTEAAGGGDIPSTPIYNGAYCAGINQWDPSNPFTGWPTADPAFHNPAFITAYFCDSSYGQGWEHEGVDFGFFLGTDVVATAAAEVVQAGWHPMLGNLVVLCSNGWCARYAHLSQIDTVMGEIVPKGQVLGQVGDTGNGAFGVHLHYDLYSSQGFADPFPTLYQ